MIRSRRLGQSAASSAMALIGISVSVFAACGGTTVDGGNGDASIGGSAAVGGQSNAGGAVGAGAAVGFGGNHNAGGSPGFGGSTGGSASGTGGTSSECRSNEDCTACAYDTAPANVNQCYCANCAVIPKSIHDCDFNRYEWMTYCTNAPIVCLAIACIIPSPVVCINGLCTTSGVLVPGTD